jgi:signal transduction histidine kinase
MTDSQFGVLDTSFRAIGGHSSGKRMILSGVDVTARRNLEVRLGAAQRMETIGLVTSEIAHDFSNYISAISGFAEFLTDDTHDIATRKSFLQRILRACDVAKQTIAQILAYGRPQTADKGEAELCGVLRNVETVVHPLIAAPVAFAIDLPDESVFVSGSEAQLSQIFVNLCTNARDSILGRPGKVSLRMTCITPGAADHPATLNPATEDILLSLRQMGAADPSAAYACIVVSDDGDGIDRVTLERIFEPFYTTKPRSRGTGLGLAIIHGIVLSLNGVYRLESRPGKGTHFAVYLPARIAREPRTSLAA